MSGEFRFVFYPSDYERAVEFYRDELGLSAVGGWDRGDGDRGILLQAASGIVELLEGPGAEDAPHEAGPPRGAWIAIEVENADGAYQNARGRGLAVEEGLEDKPWGHRSFAVRDPDGLLVVLFQITG